MPGYDDLRTLRVEEAAEILGVRPEAVRIWAREGRLAAYKVGRRLRFRPQAIEEFLEGCRLEVPNAADMIRRGRTGKARGGGRRMATRRAGLPSKSRPAGGGSQPGRAAGPRPERPSGCAPAEEPAAAVR